MRLEVGFIDCLASLLTVGIANSRDVVITGDRFSGVGNRAAPDIGGK